MSLNKQSCVECELFKLYQCIQTVSIFCWRVESSKQNKFPRNQTLMQGSAPIFSSWGHLVPLEGQGRLRWPHNHRRYPQDAPRYPQDNPKMAPTSPKMAPREPPKGLIGASWGRFGASWGCFLGLFEGVLGPHGASWEVLDAWTKILRKPAKTYAFH